ncbi:MAG TPA: hypothetical protein PKX00_20180, partial [Opitutaceae bacterium]|nr:hypothetical protein [Opitutaceae bacterium]
RLDPLLMEAWDEQEFTAWLYRTKPDVVVTKFVEVQALVLRLGFRVPRDLGTVFLTCTEPGSELSGVYENPDDVGAAAVDYLTSMTHRNERGVPRVAQRILIESSWIEGSPVRPSAVAASSVGT